MEGGEAMDTGEKNLSQQLGIAMLGEEAALGERLGNG